MTPAQHATFLLAFAALLGNEGGFTNDARDSGNWTGGAVGKGRLVGTRWGISAAAYPTLDIANLTQAQAADIYLASYWLAARCDLMPDGLALLMFDAAVNNGVKRAVGFLQLAIGAKADGAFGPGTAAALSRALGNGSPDRVRALRIEFQAQRLEFMAALATWQTYGLGWARRLVRMADMAAAWPANEPSTAARAA